MCVYKIAFFLNLFLVLMRIDQVFESYCLHPSQVRQPLEQACKLIGLHLLLDLKAASN